MDNPPAVTKSKNHWKMVGVILIVLAVILAAATGYLLWARGDQKSQIDDLNNKITQANNQISSVKSQLDDANKTIEQNANTSGASSATAQFPTGTQFFTVQQWGVKFILPADLSISNGEANIVSKVDGNVLYLSTDKVTALGGVCANFPLVTISRQTTDPTDAITGYFAKLGKLGNYYYIASNADSACGTDAQIKDDILMSFQLSGANSLKDMAMTLMAQ